MAETPISNEQHFEKRKRRASGSRILFLQVIFIRLNGTMEILI